MKTEKNFIILTLFMVHCQPLVIETEDKEFICVTREMLDKENDTEVYDNFYEGDVETNFAHKVAPKKWPNGVIYFKLGSMYDVDHVMYILRAMKTIEAVSCVRFRYASDSTKAFVRIRGNSKRCGAKVGYTGREQSVHLINDPLNKGCFKKGIILQVLLQALGFYYQHRAANRDQFIRIVWENIKEGKKKLFQKLDSNIMKDFGVGYDYKSVMHFHRKMFSKNGNDTIIPLVGKCVEIGKQRALSDGDIIKLNNMYECS